mgnify:CR=1 FL=1
MVFDVYCFHMSQSIHSFLGYLFCTTVYIHVKECKSYLYLLAEFILSFWVNKLWETAGKIFTTKMYMIFVVKVDRMDDKLHQISWIIKLFCHYQNYAKLCMFTFLHINVCRLRPIYFLSFLYPYMTWYAYMQTRMVKVCGLSPKATEQDIYDFFSFSGDIENVNVISYME